MAIINPKDVVRMVKNSDFDLYKNMQIQMGVGYLTDIKLWPDDDAIESIVSVLDHELGIKVTAMRVLKLLQLYPKVAIDVARWGVGDTETRAAVMDMLSDFYLNSTWPTYGDELTDDEMSVFINELRNQVATIDTLI